jgi:hypothetical protein
MAITRREFTAVIAASSWVPCMDCGWLAVAARRFAIYDPGRDPQAKFAAPLVRCMANGIRSIPT